MPFADAWEESGKVPREVLKEMGDLGLLGIKYSAEHGGSELDEDEIEIMRGAISLSEKRVRDIMTPLKSVYWLTPDTVVNPKKIDEIKANAHSRIPIFNATKTVSYGMLLMKDLVDINFDERSYLVEELRLRPSCDAPASENHARHARAG